MQNLANIFFPMDRHIHTYKGRKYTINTKSKRSSAYFFLFRQINCSWERLVCLYILMFGMKFFIVKYVATYSSDWQFVQNKSVKSHQLKQLDLLIVVVTVTRPNSLIRRDFVITGCLTVDTLKTTDRLPKSPRLVGSTINIQYHPFSWRMKILID